MSERGFTLVELLVACLVVMAVTGAVVAMAVPSRHAFERTLAAADLSGGSRAALDQLVAELREAGSGGAIGPHAPGLADVAAVVVPLADLGSASIASPARAVRIMRIARGAAQGVLSQPVSAGGVNLQLGTASQCTDIGPACGFAPGMTAVVFDRTRSSIVVIASVTGGGVQLAAGVATAFAAGATLAAVALTTYGVRPNADGTERLVRRSTDGAEQPMLQGVVGFELFVRGRAHGPRPGASDEAWPDYGPAPPRAGQDDPRDTWPPGESCTVARDGDGGAMSRLPPLAPALDAVAIPTAMLTDGPWCADASDASAFDADLLRLREIDVRLRVDVPSASFRGPVGRLFRRPGASTNAARWVPDVELRTTVALRNRP